MEFQEISIPDESPKDIYTFKLKVKTTDFMDLFTDFLFESPDFLFEK